MAKKKNKRTYLIIFMIGVVYALYILGVQQVKIFQHNKKLEKNNQIISELEQETKELQDIKEKHESDKFIEKIAREKLGYVKPGEKIYIDVSKQ